MKARTRIDGCDDIMAELEDLRDRLLRTGTETEIAMICFEYGMRPGGSRRLLDFGFAVKI